MLPLLLLALILPQAASALEPHPMSPSVVLVLKLVSATHVQPTTGIVISNSGLVLVPADFVSSEGEIIVLDGGTDIVKNGRPAVVAHHPQAGGLAVLSVKGLNRPGITLSANTPDKEPESHMSAFPPAELIAKGAPPLWAPVSIVKDEPGKLYLVSPETPLPNIFGPILNGCGYLAGVSFSTGPQSLQPAETPVNVFADELTGSFELMQIELPRANCDFEAVVAETPLKTEVSGTKEPGKDINKPDLIKPEVYRPEIKRKRLNPFQGASPPQGKPQRQAKPSIWRSLPFWVPLTGLIILGALVLKGVFYFRLVKDKKKPLSNENELSGTHSASEEPDTAPLDATSDVNQNLPRSAPVYDLELPDMSTRPEGCNAVLLVEGQLDPDTSFRRFCFVNTDKVNVVIGRTDADISIEYPAISRRHVRIESNGESLTLSDLGSRNGTSVGDIPCLPEEILYIKPEDEIYLGDVKCTIKVVRQEAEWA